MVTFWEIVLNDGESGGLFLEESEAWAAFGGMEEGTRLVGYWGSTEILVEYEAQDGVYMLITPCPECLKMSFGDCFECQLINQEEGV